jgi:hypothetical protein
MTWENTICFEWQWIPKTKTYLLIFWLHPTDYGNLRARLDGGDTLEITWAPTHVEQGLISELLSIANRLNGLKEYQKCEIKPLLTIRAFMTENPIDYDTTGFSLTEQSVNFLKNLITSCEKGTFNIRDYPDWEMYSLNERNHYMELDKKISDYKPRFHPE